MKTVTLTVSHALWYFVQTQVDEADREPLWHRVHYHVQLKAAARAFWITLWMLPLGCLTVPFLPPAGAVMPTVMTVFVWHWLLLLHGFGIRWRVCNNRLKRTLATDEARIRAIGRSAVAISQNYQLGDRTERVTITLPDD